MPPIWFDPSPWLMQIWDMLFWGALGLIGLIALIGAAIPIAKRLGKLLWWSR